MDQEPRPKPDQQTSTKTTVSGVNESVKRHGFLQRIKNIFPGRGSNINLTGIGTEAVGQQISEDLGIADIQAKSGTEKTSTVTSKAGKKIQKAPSTKQPAAKEAKNADSATEGVWRNVDHDTPVKVTGSLGIGPDGREYVSVEGSTSGVPRDEIDFGKTQENPSTTPNASKSRLKNPFRRAKKGESSAGEPPPLDTQLASAIEGLQGAPATPEQVKEVKKGLIRRVASMKVFGYSLPMKEFLIGGATSSAVKLVARSGLAFAGVSGLPAFAAIGAAGGGATGGVREYLRQRKEINQKDSEQLAQIRRGLKRELHRLKAADIKRVGKAALRGAAYGAVGGVIGAEIVDYVSNSEFIQDKVSKAAEYIRENANPVYTAMGDKVPGVQEVQAIQAQAIPEVPAVNVPEVKLPETPITQIKPALPRNLESVNLESGSNPWAKVHGYLAENLGREPTNLEIQSAVARVLTENNIPDATKIPVGTKLNLSGVNNYVEGLLGNKNLLSPEIASLPESVSLPQGSNPWNEVAKYLEDGLDRPPTNAEILEVTKAVSLASDIKVPDWGIDGANLDTQLQPGYKINFNDDVKRAIQNIVDNPDVSVIPDNNPRVPAIDSQPLASPQPVVPESVLPAPTITDSPPPTQTPTPETAASQAGIPNELKTFYLAPENRNAQGIKNFVQNYLMFNLGRQVSPEEISAGMEKVAIGYNISDSANLPKDFELNLTGLNQYIKQIKSQ